jgi:hypothetical protein
LLIEFDALYTNDKSMSNIISQLYSINEVKKIYQQYIIDNNINYDFIVLGRYDLIIDAFPNLHLLNNTFFYLSNNHTHFPDFMYIFSNNYINFLSTYENIEQLIIENQNDFNTELFWAPNAECFKYANYRKYYNILFIRPIMLKHTRIN